MPNIQPGRRRRAGFTLTEMLIVLVILGLLAAIVGPRLFSRLDNAKQRTARLQISRIEAALDLYRLDTGELPTQSQGLAALQAAPSGVSDWFGPYFEDDLPVDPWGHAYRYGVNADGDACWVVSLGSDEQPGGTGRAADIFSSAKKQRLAEDGAARSRPVDSAKEEQSVDATSSEQFP